MRCFKEVSSKRISQEFPKKDNLHQGDSPLLEKKKNSSLKQSTNLVFNDSSKFWTPKSVPIKGVLAQNGLDELFEQFRKKNLKFSN